MERLEVPPKGLNVHLRTTGVWLLLLKGLSKQIKQNVHLEVTGCMHLENWRKPGHGFVLSFFLNIRMEQNWLLLNCGLIVRNVALQYI